MLLYHVFEIIFIAQFNYFIRFSCKVFVVSFDLLLIFSSVCGQVFDRSIRVGRQTSKILITISFSLIEKSKRVVSVRYIIQFSYCNEAFRQRKIELIGRFGRILHELT